MAHIPFPPAFSPADLEIARVLGLEPSPGDAGLALLEREPASTEDLWRDVRRVAGALGVPERGVQIVTRWRHRLRAIALRAASRPRRRVAVLAGDERGAACVEWRVELLALAGADDALAGAAGDDTRSLVLADPDAIVIAPAGEGLESARAAFEARGRDPAWRSLRAVRCGQVLLADGRAGFARPGANVTHTLEVLAEALHPEAFRFGHHGRFWKRCDA